MKFNIKAMALAGGIFWAVTLFWEVLIGGTLGITTLWASPEGAQMVYSFYPGVNSSIMGLFLALVYGFVCGAFCGGIFASLYNLILKKVS